MKGDIEIAEHPRSMVEYSIAAGGAAADDRQFQTGTVQDFTHGGRRQNSIKDIVRRAQRVIIGGIEKTPGGRFNEFVSHHTVATGVAAGYQT